MAREAAASRPCGRLKDEQKLVWIALGRLRPAVLGKLILRDTDSLD
ncbi:MAG TPA: hypothetical protein VE077_20230 [Candidatus Methylomirabilis sp.]|nr:hypothetical protein [Candidatus Methylomirabilis sp.]